MIQQRLVFTGAALPELRTLAQNYLAQGMSLVEISQQLKLDLALLPAGFQTPSLVVFDMDSTLIRAEVIDELAVEAGVGDKVKAITERAMQGEMNFDESLRARVAMLKGLKESALARVYQRIQFNPGVPECLAELRRHGIKTAIASGGFSYFAQLFAQRLEMDFAFANVLEIEQGELTGKIRGEILNAQKKADLLLQLSSDLGVSPAQVVAVGDGANDLPMLKTAGLGVAFHAKSKVQKEAQGLINHAGMEALIDFFGLKARGTDAV